MANGTQEELLGEDEIKAGLSDVEKQIEAAEAKNDHGKLQDLYLKRERLQEAEFKRSIARRNKGK